MQSALSDERSDEQQGADEAAKAVAADDLGAEAARAPSVARGDRCVSVESEDVGLDAAHPESLLSISRWMAKWRDEQRITEEKRTQTRQVNRWLLEDGFLEKEENEKEGKKTYKVSEKARAMFPDNQFGKHPEYSSPIFGGAAAEYILEVVKGNLSSNEKG